MKIFIAMQISILVLFGYSGIVNNTNVIYAEKEIPPYAKWGQLAMQKTKQKYPEADIIDYLHIGRETGTVYSIEKFKLWLRKDNKEFGVFVNITFDNFDESIIDIKFRETAK